MTSKYDQPILDYMKPNRWYTSRDIAYHLGFDPSTSRKRNMNVILQSLTKYGFIECKQMWDEDIGKTINHYRKVKEECRGENSINMET